MKKTLFSILALFMCSILSAQNPWYIGGMVGFGSTNEDFGQNYSSSSWTLSPEIGTVFNDDWSAGFVLGLSGSSSSDDDGDIMKTSMMMPDIYGRRWFNLDERLNLFVGLDVAFGSGTTTMYGAGPNGSDLESETSAFNTNLNTGITYSLGQRWALLFKLSGLGFTNTTVDDNKTSSFGFLAEGNVTTSQFVFVGIYYNFIQP